MEKIKPCCKHGKRIKIVDDKLRDCMVPKPDKGEKRIIVFDTDIIMLGGIKYCPFCGVKIQVINVGDKNERKNKEKSNISF